MKKLTILILLLLITLYAKNNKIIKENIDYSEIRKEIILNVLFIQESQYNEKAINDSTKASGIIQIKKIYVDEVNRIINVSKWVKRLNRSYSAKEISKLTNIVYFRCLSLLKMPNYTYFKYDDRFNFELSIEMFTINNNYWFPEYDLKEVLKSHGCGNGKTGNYLNRSAEILYEKYNIKI